VRVDLRAANGKLEASPLSADLYGGKLAGALTASAGQPARFAAQQTLSGIHVGPLLQDATGKQPIEGKGNVQLDVAAAGDTFDSLMKSLDGSARLELRDGAVRGVNIAQVVRNAKAKIGELRGSEAPQTGTASAVEKTDFSELNASFRIVNGVAHNDDLLIKSPLARVTGSGDVNLGAERIDYLVRATIVSTLQGQGGPELQALKGLTIPIRLTGPFGAIDWRVDFSGIASELAKQKFEEKKEDLKAKAQKSLEEEKAKLQNQLKDQLKGLFKR
jgi:AsmA protein